MADEVVAEPRAATSGSEEVSAESAPLTRGFLGMMAAACGMTVANMYYCQPLLAQMGRAFGVAERQAGLVALATQMGCAAGMLLFVPLGDIRERRGLTLQLLAGVTVALLVTALAPTLSVLLLAGVAIGLTSTIPHVLLPFVAQLAPPQARGRAVGTVLSGLLIGILLARTVSGYVGAVWGWRAMYGIAALLMVGLALVLARLLPRSRPTVDLTYSQTLKSLWTLARTQPVLREAACIGALSFGAFSAFWTTLVFLLEGVPYHYAAASEKAGLFGLVGVVGAAAAPRVGRLADRYSPRLPLALALITLALSYGFFWRFGGALWGLVVGVILLDFGVQAAHVANQTRIYALLPEARSRLNTVYMVSYFLGGSVGSYLGAWGWSVAHWNGVCAVGLLLSLSALATLALGRAAAHRHPPQNRPESAPEASGRSRTR
jgi:predicted MFS family arabinose efflux permease